MSACSKLLVAVLPIFLLAWLRFGIAAVAMLHWVRRGGRRGHRCRGTTAGCCSGRAFLGNFLFSICMLYGVGH